MKTRFRLAGALAGFLLLGPGFVYSPFAYAGEVPPVSDAPDSVAPLTLDEVVSGVVSQYPPFLAAMIEQDIANGRARQASGAFDTTLNLGVTGRPAGYYDGTTGSAMLEQPLSFWGGGVFAGYRLSSGYLPNYNKERTPEDGQFVVGFRLPLLRDGGIDTRRVKLRQALIDRQLADPNILRQRLDFVRAATIAYYTWVATGHRLMLAEELLRVARERDGAIARQVELGAVAPIVRIDNERLVLSRRIALVQAQRRFEAAGIELSLFHRTKEDSQPVLARRERLPEFSGIAGPDQRSLTADISRAVEARPEMRRYALTIEKARLDERLADNDLLPNLDVSLQANQSVNGSRLKDVEATEVEGKVELKIPLERREAKGRLQAVKAQISRLEIESKFARDRIAAEVRDSFSALAAAAGQIAQTTRNVELAGLLQEAEDERFRQGATDLLALQIREQAAFDARVTDVDARAEYFRALANYRAATAAEAPTSFAADEPHESFRPGKSPESGSRQ